MCAFYKRFFFQFLMLLTRRHNVQWSVNCVHSKYKAAVVDDNGRIVTQDDGQSDNVSVSNTARH